MNFKGAKDLTEKMRHQTQPKFKEHRKETTKSGIAEYVYKKNGF